MRIYSATVYAGFSDPPTIEIDVPEESPIIAPPEPVEVPVTPEPEKVPA